MSRSFGSGSNVVDVQDEYLVLKTTFILNLPGDLCLVLQSTF